MLATGLNAASSIGMKALTEIGGCPSTLIG